MKELLEKLAVEVQQAFSGARLRRPSNLKRASSLDIRRTILDPGTELMAGMPQWSPTGRQLAVVVGGGRLPVPAFLSS